MVLCYVMVRVGEEDGKILFLVDASEVCTVEILCVVSYVNIQQIP